MTLLLVLVAILITRVAVVVETVQLEVSDGMELQDGHTTVGYSLNDFCAILNSTLVILKHGCREDGGGIHQPT